MDLHQKRCVLILFMSSFYLGSAIDQEDLIRAAHYQNDAAAIGLPLQPIQTYDRKNVAYLKETEDPLKVPSDKQHVSLFNSDSAKNFFDQISQIVNSQISDEKPDTSSVPPTSTATTATSKSDPVPVPFTRSVDSSTTLPDSNLTALLHYAKSYGYPVETLMERLRKAGLLADTSSEPTPTAQSNSTNSTSNTSPSPLAAIINSTQASSEPTVGPDSTVTNLNSSFASSNVKNSTVANSTNSSVSVTMSSREPLLTTLDGLNSTASNASQLSSPSQNPAEVNLTPSTNASLSMRLKNFSLSNYPPWMTREVAFAWCAIAFFLLTTLAFLVVCAQKYRVCSALSCCEDCALYTQI